MRMARFCTARREAVPKVCRMLDLTTGQQHQLTTFRSTDAIESFDISPDGKTILFDRVRQNADIYTIDVKPPRNR